MADKEANSIRKSFIRELRRALNYLYDPSVLRNSPLAELLGVHDRETAASALQRILTGAIQSLEPDNAVPRGSSSWRVYHVLRYRYAEQFTQAEVAIDLGMSERQLRREQRAALDVLADYLWSHYDLSPRAHLLQPRSSQANEALSESETLPSREQELDWLEKSFPIETANVGEIIESVLTTVRPLTQAAGVHVESTVPDDLPHSTVHLTATRQAFVNVITAAIRYVSRGRIAIEAEALPREIRVRIHARKRLGVSAPSRGDANESLELAQQLLRLSGGSAEITSDADGKETFIATITLPIAEQVKVLIIDDNVDTLQLFQRYLSGSRYRFIGVSDPEEVLAAAERLTPQIIVLDVMLPEIDGWVLLGRLREHPKTRDVSIIVCTIMLQEQLALALGADGFICKPVSRTAFLSALDEQLEAQAKEAR